MTVNLGLRYEVYVPDTERENRLPNYDPVGMRLVYAGEDGTSKRANKQTRWGNFAPRFGISWDATGDARNVVRAGYGRSFFPVPHAAGNLLDQNVPDSISQNYSVETNPLDFSPSRVPRLWYDVADFAAPPPNTYGNSGRGVLYAPGVKTFDVSLTRRFPVRGRASVQFRADAFNLLNTPQFGFPNANIGSPTAGRITSLQPDIGNRQLQVALKLDF